MKSFIFRFYVPLSVLIGILAVAVLAEVQDPIDWRLIVTVVGGVLSAVYLVQKQKLEESRLLKDLFTDFNGRYSKLNEELNRICQGDLTENLTQSERNTVYDYFNLCAEEYFFKKMGYIPGNVWKGWFNGMAVFFRNKKIRDLWIKDSETDSYYGFQPPAC